MDKINWVENENQYRLKTPYGVAVIVEAREIIKDETVIGARSVYVASFEYENGRVVNSEYPFPELETAEAWVLWDIVLEMDQPQEGDIGYNRLLRSLKYSEKYLPSNTPESHYKQLRLIKRIIRRKFEDIERIAGMIGQKTSVSYKPVEKVNHIDWQQQENEYFAQFDYGKVVIKEIRNQDKWTIGRAFTYYPRFENEQGVVINGWEMFNFKDAENWAISRINELNMTGELFLESLCYTLDLCIQFLPDDANPMHVLRLEWIKSRLADVLL